MGICNGNFGHFSTKSSLLVPASFAAETRSFFPIFRAQENIPPTCARNPLILRALAGIIPRQVHTEWYRSGYNGPDSKSGVPATVPWVRIPPTPPNNIHPHPRLDVVFCCGRDSKAGALVTCRWHVATGVGESHPLRQTTSIPIRGWMLFFAVGGIRKPAPWRHAGGMSQPAWENPTHSAIKSL